MDTKSRLLGLAFAAADLLIEVDSDGRVVFAVGSAPSPDSQPLAAWYGRPLVDFLGKASRAAFADATEGLADGVRSSAADVLLVCGPEQVRRAKIRAFRLPQLSPSLSCAISFGGKPFTLNIPEPPALLDADGLLGRAKEALQKAEPDESMAVAFVDVPGLSTTAGVAGRRVAARVKATLQAASVDGTSAAQLTPDRFALLKSLGDPRDLAADVREAGAAEDVNLTPRAAEANIPAGADPISALKALRFTIEGCLRDGGLDRPEQTFSEFLKKTLRDADRFRVIVKSRQFALHYQPIVDLRTEAVHHFEALARFGHEGPSAAIHMAEELGLIENFDLAVLEKAMQMMRQPGNGLIKVAVNVSGASLSTDAYIDALLRLTAAEPIERRRLLIEVTETAALADLEAADRRLRALRKSGVKVCIDDFGSGSASFDYLRGLSVDCVKIDGRLVNELAAGTRSRTVIDHLVQLCSSLGLATIGEMIETDDIADTVRDLGITYGQGWLFGKATPEPQAVLTHRAPLPVRRAGAVARWG